jgi:hypothetical protein
MALKFTMGMSIQNTIHISMGNLRTIEGHPAAKSNCFSKTSSNIKTNYKIRKTHSTQKASLEKVNNSVLYGKAMVSVILTRARHLCPC